MRTVLVLTAVEDVTADEVIAVLNHRGVPVVRVDPADIGVGLTFNAALGPDGWDTALATPSRRINLADVAAVYYRRPGPYLFDGLPADKAAFAAAEARQGLSGLLNHLTGARYVSHPAAIARAEYKTLQLQVAARLGLRPPPTLVTNDPDAARTFAKQHGPVVYKPFRGLNAVDGQACAIWAQRVDPDTIDEALAVTAHMFQAEVPKTFDARVTAVGRKLFGQRIDTEAHLLDWRSGGFETLEHSPIAVPDGVADRIRAYLDEFDLPFGAFDFAVCDTGVSETDWRFLECNPNGQWGWLPDADLIAEAVADELTEGSRA